VVDPQELRPDDVLVVWGGGDISPSLYNKKRGRFGGGSITPGERDRVEWALMQHARTIGIPIIGVCRGAQMLTALMGGYLIQHVNNHAGRGHDVITTDGEQFYVNSIHHQMMVPPSNGNYEIVARTPEPLSNEFWDEDENVTMEVEPEFIYYPDVQGFAIQWHPEGMRQETAANQYLFNFIKERL
jgi:putative glutamine amidotransferase